MKNKVKRIMALMLSLVMMLGGIPQLVNIVHAGHVYAYIYDTTTGEKISFLKGVNSSKKLNQLKVGLSYDQTVDISYEIDNEGVYEPVINTDVNFIAGKKYRLTLEFDKGCEDDYALSINDFYVGPRYSDPEAVGLFYDHEGSNPRNYERDGSIIKTRFEGVATGTPSITSVTINEQIIAGDYTLPVTICGTDLTGAYAADVFKGTKTLQEIFADYWEFYCDTFSTKTDIMTPNCTEETLNLIPWDYIFKKGSYTLLITPILRYGEEDEIVDFYDYSYDDTYVVHFDVDAWEIGTQPTKENGYEVGDLNTSTIDGFSGLSENYMWQRKATIEPSVINTLDNNLIGTDCIYASSYYLPEQFKSSDGKYHILSWDDSWYYDMINDTYDGVIDGFDYSLLNNGYAACSSSDYYKCDFLLAGEELSVGSKVIVELDSTDDSMNWEGICFKAYNTLSHDDDNNKKYTFIVTDDMLSTSGINNVNIYVDAYSPFIVKKITVENENWEDIVSETTNKLLNPENGYIYRCKVTCGGKTIYSKDVSIEEGNPDPEPTPSRSSKKYKATDTKDTTEKITGTGKKGSKRTIVPEEGRKVANVTVTDKEGNEIEVTMNEDGTYSFVQPASNVNVEVTYKNREITLNIGSTIASVDGERENLDVCPVIRNDRTMLPIRFIAENLGAKVEWSEKNPNYVVISRGNTKIEITLGSDIMKVNGSNIVLDSVAFAENDRTYLPVRAVSEALNAYVEWHENEPSVVKIFER